MAGSVRLAALTLLATLVIVVAAPAASAAKVDDVALEAVVELQGEVMLLVELGAFPEPVPQDLLDIHEANRRFLQGLTRIQLLGWFAEKEDGSALALAAFDDGGFDVSGDVRTVLEPLPPADLDALEGGGTIALPADSYVRALIDLNLRDGGAEASFPIAPVAGVVAIAGVAVAALAMRRRRPEVSHVTPAGEERLGRLLEAGRRMTKALDRDEIVAIACGEAVSLVVARHALFAGAGEGGVRLLHASSDGLVDERRLADGVVGRIVETGQPVRAVVRDEPALTSLPVALLAVPVIASGRVAGVLAVLRDDEAPFDATESDALMRLAPMIGSALDAAARHDGVTELTMVDGLTGLANRRRLDRDLPDALAWASSSEERMVGFLMIDVDHFKTYNDTHGHAAGDAALRTVAELLRANVREGDVVYRYGGEEFSVLLRDTTLEEAEGVAERLREAVQSAAFKGERSQPGGMVTISLGLHLTRGEEPDTCAAAADEALYSAKHGGRNRVVVG